jgi:hypothetical protein
VFVFHRPSRGWTGIIHQHATLTVPSINWGSPPIATFGSSLVAGVLGSSTPSAEVFNKPRRGWSGRIRAAARLGPKPLPNDGDSSRYTNSLAASGGMIALEFKLRRHAHMHRDAEHLQPPTPRLERHDPGRRQRKRHASGPQWLSPGNRGTDDRHRRPRSDRPLHAH